MKNGLERGRRGSKAREEAFGHRRVAVASVVAEGMERRDCLQCILEVETQDWMMGEMRVRKRAPSRTTIFFPQVNGGWYCLL